MPKLLPDTPAWFGDDEGDTPDDRQFPSYQAILEYVREADELPIESARPFAAWLYANWLEYDDGTGTQTNALIIAGALTYWRGQ